MCVYTVTYPDAIITTAYGRMATHLEALTGADLAVTTTAVQYLAELALIQSADGEIYRYARSFDPAPLSRLLADRVFLAHTDGHPLTMGGGIRTYQPLRLLRTLRRLQERVDNAAEGEAQHRALFGDA